MVLKQLLPAKITDSAYLWWKLTENDRT